MEEVKEIVYTAANLIFLGAVITIAVLFLGLRSTYANTVTQKINAEHRIEMQNKFKDFDSLQVTGFDVMSGITSYADTVPMYVTGAYNYITKDVVQNRLYSKGSRISNPEWFKMSLDAEPIRDAWGMQCMYRKETVYYAILTYDSDTPQQLAKDLGLDTATGTPNIPGRKTGLATSTMLEKESWLSAKYMNVRPNGHTGYTVSGVLFVCLDAFGAAEVQYNQVAIH